MSPPAAPPKAWPPPNPVEVVLEKLWAGGDPPRQVLSQEQELSIDKGEKDILGSKQHVKRQQGQTNSKQARVSMAPLRCGWNVLGEAGKGSGRDQPRWRWKLELSHRYLSLELFSSLHMNAVRLGVLSSSLKACSLL